MNIPTYSLAALVIMALLAADYTTPRSQGPDVLTTGAALEHGVSGLAPNASGTCLLRDPPICSH